MTWQQEPILRIVSVLAEEMGIKLQEFVLKNPNVKIMKMDADVNLHLVLPVNGGPGTNSINARLVVPFTISGSHSPSPTPMTTAGTAYPIGTVKSLEEIYQEQAEKFYKDSNLPQ